MALIDSSVGGGRRRIPKKKKRKLVPTTTPQGVPIVKSKQGYKPAEYKPPKSPDRGIPIAGGTLLERDEDMPLNITNLNLAANNAGVKLTAEQQMHLLQNAKQGFSTNEWGMFLGPSALGKDTFNMKLGDALRNYYSFTGKFPDASTAKNIIENPDTIWKLEPWKHKGLEILDILGDHANERASARMGRGKRWTVKDIKKMPRGIAPEGLSDEEEADWLRHLANAPMTTLGRVWAEDDRQGKNKDHELMTNQDRTNIDLARHWYLGTPLKKRIIKRQNEEAVLVAQNYLTNPDGTANKNAVRLIESLSGRDGSMSRFVAVRDRSFGDKYEDLKPALRDDIQMLGAKLTSVFPDFIPDKNGHYTWSPLFDRYASAYILMANIGDATAMNPYKKDSADWKLADKKKKIATANISIATHGAIKTDDDLRLYMQNMGFLGDKDKPGNWTDQYTQWLFEECYMKTKAAKDEPIEVSVMNFAKDNGGREGLPNAYKKFYDQILEEIGPVLGEIQNASGVPGAFSAIFQNEIDTLENFRKSYIPDMAPQTEPIPGVLGTVSSASKLVDRLKSTGTAASGKPTLNGVEYNIDDEGNIILNEEPGAGFHSAGGHIIGSPRGIKGNIEKGPVAIDPDDKLSMWFTFTASPKIKALTDGVINGIQRQYNRVYLTLAFMGEAGGGTHAHLSYVANPATIGLEHELKGAAERDDWGKSESLMYGSMISGAGGPAQLSIPLEANQYSFETMSDAWNRAGQLAGDLNQTPFQREFMKDFGLDPDEHGGLLFWSDLSWSVGLDVLMDAGVGAIARAGATSTASVMRKLTSQRLLDYIDIAKTKLAVKGGAVRLAELEDTRDVFLRKASIARANGDEVLAASFERRADSVFADLDTTYRADMTPEEQLAHSISEAVSPTEAHVYEYEGKATINAAEKEARKAVEDTAKQHLDDVTKEAKRLKKAEKKKKYQKAFEKATPEAEEPEKSAFDKAMDRVKKYQDELMSSETAPTQEQLDELNRLKRYAEREHIRSKQTDVITGIMDPDFADSQILNRPVWYDTFATGLAKNVVDGTKVRFILGLKASHVAPELQYDFYKILDDIGASLDPDEITILMNRLRVNFKLNLDPARIFMGKLNQFRRIEGDELFASFTHILPNDIRISSGCGNIEDHTYDLGKLTNMGLARGRESEANELMWSYISRIHNIDKTLPLYRQNQIKQKIWREMNDLIEQNMRSRKISAEKIAELTKAAKRVGLRVDEGIGKYIKTEWDGYNAYRHIKNWKMLGKTLESGGKKGVWYDDLQSSVPYLLAGEKTSGQQANDLVSHFNLQDIVAYQTNHYRQMMWRVTPGTAFFGLPIGFGPSFYGMAQAGRTLATASLAFPFSALFIDEFWRIPVEWLNRNVAIRGWKAAKELTKGHGLREAASDAFEESIRQTHEIVPISPDMPGYTGYLNRWIQAFKDQDFSDIYIDFMGKFTDEELDTITPAAMKEMFRQHLMERIMGEGGEQLRGVLADTGRGLTRSWDNPEYIKAAQDEWDDIYGSLHDELRRAKIRKKELSDEISKLDDMDITVYGAKDFVVESKLTDVQLQQVFPEYQITQNRRIARARMNFNNHQTPKNWNKLKQAIVDEIQEDINDLNKSIKEADIQFQEGLDWEAEQAAKAEVDNLPTETVAPVDESWKAQDSFEGIGAKSKRVAAAREEYLRAPSAENFEAYKKEASDYLRRRMAFAKREDKKAMENAATVATTKADEATSEEAKRLQKQIDAWTKRKSRPTVKAAEKQELQGFIDGAQSKLDALAKAKKPVSTEAEEITVEQDKIQAAIEAVENTFYPAAAPDVQAIDIADEFAGLTDEGIDKVLDSAPPSNLANLTPDQLRAQLKVARDELKRIKRRTLPKSVHEPEIIEKAVRKRTTKLANLLHVERPTSAAWIWKYLQDKGLMKTFPDWMDVQLRASFKDAKDVRRWWKEKGFPDELYDEMYQDYKIETLANRGLTQEPFDVALENVKGTATHSFTSGLKMRRDELVAQREMNQALIKETKRKAWAHKKAGRPRSLELTKAGDEYITDVVDRLTAMDNVPQLRKALRDGRKLNKSEIKALQKAGYHMPSVMGALGSHTAFFRNVGKDYGWLPIISRYSELLPYKVLNHLGNKTREICFLGNFNVEYKSLLRAGWNEKDALEAAQQRALTYVDKVMYSPGMTAMESNMSSFFYFLPAYRQAMLYWGKQFVKHPFVMAHLRETFKEDMPMTWMGDYGMYMPLPFFLSNSVSESVVPGLTLPILLPLRGINALSGWKEVDDETGGKEWIYTQNTKFDKIIENPLTGFASKNVAPISFVDDLIFGVLGQSSYFAQQTDNFGMAMLLSAMYAFRKDPIARQKAAASVMLSQIANGDAPNLTTYEKRLRGADWLNDVLIKVFGENSSPEALIGAFSRQFLPRKLSYSPSDIGEHTEAAGKPSRSFWDHFTLFGDQEDARTIMEAQYLYYDAEGDPAKQAEILSRFPKLKTIFGFWKKDALEKEEFLMKPENRWAIPYVTGKNMYDKDTGFPLTNQEYNEMLTSGAIRRRSNKELLARVTNMYVNADWSTALKTLETERDTRLKQAHKYMVGLINKYAISENDKRKKLESLEGFENAWWGYTANMKYEPKFQTPSGWMWDYVSRDKNYKWAYNNPFAWNPAAINQAHYDATNLAGEYGHTYGKKTIIGQRPEGADYEGVEGYYTNATVLKEGQRKDMRRISDALAAILEPDDMQLFSAKHSISYNQLQEQQKKDDDKRRYSVMKVLKTPYYYIDSAELMESALPNLFNPVDGIGTKMEMNAWLSRSSDLYQMKLKKIDEANGDYKKEQAIYDWYDKQMANMMKKPIAAPFRNGLAGMMMYSYLVDQGDGTFDHSYAKMVAKELTGKQPDYDDITDYGAVSKKGRDKAIAANAWAGLFVAANQMKVGIQYERTNETNHIEDRTRQYTDRLERYVDEWKKKSALFRTQWHEEKGDSMLAYILKEAF